MRVARARLIVAAVVFFGWLCWLGYLAANKTRPVVVSHSQIMTAGRFVVAEVTLDPATGALNKTVQVVEDLRPDGTPLTGSSIEVRNLDQAEIAGGDSRFRDHGKYLLPLNPNPPGQDKVFELVRPPGRVYRPPGNERRTELGRPWAYVWDNEEVRRQFGALVPR